MTSDRYLPRAPSLRPAPKRRQPTIQEIADEIEAAEHEFRPVRNPPQADLPAQPARGPWEPKED